MPPERGAEYEGDRGARFKLQPINYHAKYSVKTMIVLVGNTKGGSGKTTLALNLAIARALTGRRVWLVDGDSQRSASTAMQLRAEAGRKPMLAVGEFDHGPTLRTQVGIQRNHFDDVLIDAGGRDSTSLRAALTLADVLVVPFLPRSIDVWALDDMAHLVDEARSVRDGLRALAVLSMADPSGADNAAAAHAASEHEQFTYADAPIGRRKAFAEAAGRGLAVLELSQRNAKAEVELDALMSLIFM